MSSRDCGASQRGGRDAATYGVRDVLLGGVECPDLRRGTPEGAAECG